MSNQDEPYSDDDGYDEYEAYDQHKQNYAKKWFKFDPNIWGWLNKAMEDITETSPNVWSFKINTVPDFPAKEISTSQFLGVNSQGAKIWKTKYFANNPLAIEYLNHIKSYPAHFVNQPHYYKGMFDILN